MWSFPDGKNYIMITLFSLFQPEEDPVILEEETFHEDNLF